MEILEMQIFETNVKNLKINSIIEKNNFNFVRDMHEGKIEFDYPGYSNISLDEYFINININEIEKAILNNNVNTSKGILNQLKERLNNLKQNYQEFIDYYNKTSQSEKRLLNDVKEKIYYDIIELRVSLGLNLSKFAEENAYEYAEAIQFDVINHKYKRLDIQNHVINGVFRNEKA